MTYFLTGFALFVALHFIPSLAPGVKRSLQGLTGKYVYKGIFAVCNLAAFSLMSADWRLSGTWDLYEPPDWGRSIAYGLILVAFLLFAVSVFKTNVKRFVRHPQLAGVVLWAIGHLLVNGDNYSVVLFGSFGVWALAQTALINRREGPWQKPDPLPFRSEILPVAIGLAAYTGFVFAHRYVIGVSPFPY